MLDKLKKKQEKKRHDKRSEANSITIEFRIFRHIEIVQVAFNYIRYMFLL